SGPTKSVDSRGTHDHPHVRDGEMLKVTLPFTAAHFGRAILMPNLIPPVRTTADGIAYRERAMAALPKGSTFKPLITCYLTDDTDPDDVERGFREGVFTEVKLYPAHATTNSAAGVTESCYFLGTDSAPHPVAKKLALNGIPGIFNAPVAMA